MYTTSTKKRMRSQDNIPLTDELCQYSSLEPVREADFVQAAHATRSCTQCCASIKSQHNIFMALDLPFCSERCRAHGMENRLSGGQACSQRKPLGRSASVVLQPLFATAC